MTLLVAEVESGHTVEQSVTPTRNVIVEAIRPHLYRHKAPAGTLHLEIYDGSNALVATSESITITTMGTLDYYHGYIRFYINAYLTKGQTYKIRLVSSGYTFSELAYCGWVNGCDLGKYPAVPTPSKTLYSPLDLEIWERTP